MSADRWSVCPKCKKKAEELDSSLSQKVLDAYGKVTLVAFDAMRAEELRRHLEEGLLDSTLREDFEQGIILGADGEDPYYFVNFRAVCQEASCGFQFPTNTERIFPDV